MKHKKIHILGGSGFIGTHLIEILKNDYDLLNMDLRISNVNPSITKINNLTKEQINAYRIADNRTNEEAEWDDELLALEIKDLEMKDFNLELTGMNKPELDELLFQEKQGNTDDDEVPETPEEPITKPGDIWQLGKHRIICGDSTLPETYQKLLADKKVDLYLTDPPYNIEIFLLLPTPILFARRALIFK